MILKTLFIALAGAAAWKMSAGVRARMQHQPAARKPYSENRWEGEGGALRDSGAQLGPEPTVVKAG